VYAQTATEPICDLESGKKLFWADKDSEKRLLGFAAIKCAAVAGNPESQAYLATLLETGLAGTKDSQEAAIWLEKAAIQSHPPAISRLAFAYLHGIGVRQDKVRARELLNEAAKFGDVQAMANLGAMYGMGDSVPQSNRLAADWYKKAADGGGMNGQIGLANMLFRGHGVEQNYTECFLYASLAARQKHPRAASLASECEGRISSEDKVRILQQVEGWKPNVSK
jgi:TPR repeat protein